MQVPDRGNELRDLLARLRRGGQSGSIGLGFSIPINQAKRIADELIASGHATQAPLGVSVQGLRSPTGPSWSKRGARLGGRQVGLQPATWSPRSANRLIENSDALVRRDQLGGVRQQRPPSPCASGAGAPRQVPVTLGSVTAS